MGVACLLVRPRKLEPAAVGKGSTTPEPSDVIIMSWARKGRHSDRPFQLEANACHQAMSEQACSPSRIQLSGYFLTHERSIRRCREDLPGLITGQAGFRTPTKDCSLLAGLARSPQFQLGLQVSHFLLRQPQLHCYCMIPRNSKHEVGPGEGRLSGAVYSVSLVC